MSVITHAKEKSQQHQSDLQQVEKAFADANIHLQQDKEKNSNLLSRLEELEPEFEMSKETEQLSAQSLAQQESTMQNWQLRWDEFNQNAQEPSQTAQVERARINQLEQNISNQERRVEKLQDELQHFSSQHLEESISQLETEVNAIEQTTTQLQLQLDQERDLGGARNVQRCRPDPGSSRPACDLSLPGKELAPLLNDAGHCPKVRPILVARRVPDRRAPDFCLYLRR